MTQKRTLTQSPDRMDVLRLIVSGHTSAQIAKARGRSIKTIEVQRLRIFRELGANNAVEAVVKALQLGIVGVPGLKRVVRRKRP